MQLMPGIVDGDLLNTDLPWMCVCRMCAESPVDEHLSKRNSQRLAVFLILTMDGTDIHSFKSVGTPIFNFKSDVQHTLVKKYRIPSKSYGHRIAP